MGEVIQNMYKSVSSAAQQFAFLRNFKAPLDINAVMHSLADLENYISTATIAYPGQIIAIDDNLSDTPNILVENRDEIGLYYIYYDYDEISPENSKLAYRKLAFSDNVEEYCQNIINLLNKINNYQVNNPWEVMYDNNQTGPNIYNKDEKLNNNIISEYNKSGISINITPVTNKVSNKV